MVRKDNVVPFLCRCDGEGIILCKHNGGFVLIGEDNIYPVLKGGDIHLFVNAVKRVSNQESARAESVKRRLTLNHVRALHRHGSMEFLEVKGRDYTSFGMLNRRSDAFIRSKSGPSSHHKLTTSLIN